MQQRSTWNITDVSDEERILLTIASIWLGIEITPDTGSSSTYTPGDYSPSNYIKNYQGFAKFTKQYFQVPTLFTLAQGGHESNWGESKLARESKNHFGIKGLASWRGLSDPTNTYRAYNSVQDSYNDHAKFLVSNSRYANAFNTTDPFQFAQAVASAKYATDPDYYNKITKRMKQVQQLASGLGVDVS